MQSPAFAFMQLLLVSGQWVFDPKSDDWKAIQPDPDIPFEAYQPHSAKIYASWFLLPNFTRIALAGENLIEASLIGLSNRTDIPFPANEFFEALLTNGTLPELIEGQSGPLPVWDDFYCNPQFFPNGCATLDEIGAAIGIPAGHMLNGGIPLLAQRAVGLTLLNIFDRATRGITPSAVLTVQQDQLIAGTVGSLRHILVPLFDTQEGGPLNHITGNLTDLLLWDRLGQIDGPDVEASYIMESQSQLVRAAAVCRAFNGRLPYCDSLLPYDGPPTPPPYEDVREPNRTLDSHGFRQEIRLSGFRESCNIRADSCIIGGDQLNPEQFDGIYRLVGVDDIGFPLYMKSKVVFDMFQKIHRLYLRVAGYVGPKWPQGVAMIITPNLPDLTTINVQAHSPFVLVLGNPPFCRNSVDFPMCASDWHAPSTDELENKLSYSKQGTSGWFLVRDTQRGCPVPRDQVSGYCILRLAVSVD